MQSSAEDGELVEERRPLFLPSQEAEDQPQKDDETDCESPKTSHGLPSMPSWAQ